MFKKFELPCSLKLKKNKLIQTSKIGALNFGMPFQKGFVLIEAAKGRKGEKVKYRNPIH